ncbi:hypothetical protein GH714_018294 [Hevea brasiliensis]|uniref:Cytochrome P450 n=1 Tax=Hevea brasiliensis TaxID=3981 RepID=A0A6A6KW46_HEVBR|nr:hypothetical protein GH714_018294 [Hevea brasiliensis]
MEFYNLQELSKLVYIHGAICETLRLYPAVPFNHRVSVQEDTLPSGHHVKANARVMFSLYSMGTMEEIWGDDCLEFKPERWISERGSIIHVPSYKFIAFNTGPRSCLGKDITFIQMKIIATSILWNYHVKLVEDHPVAPCLSVMMHMKHGLKVRISKRVTANRKRRQRGRRFFDFPFLEMGLDLKGVLDAWEAPKMMQTTCRASMAPHGSRLLFDLGRRRVSNVSYGCDG